jgi:hypothetical protein
LNTGNRIFSLFFSMLVMVSGGRAAGLPVIEMPKYVITGVEQATALSGNRIPTESSARFLVPEFIPENRPVISLDILDTPIETPALLTAMGGGFTEVEATLGAFGKVSGRITTAAENLLTGYIVETGIEHYPMRTAVGPKLHGFVQGGGVRWMGQETTFSPSIDLSNQTFVRRGLVENETNSLFSIGFQAGITPVELSGGRLYGHFLYDLGILDGHRDLSGSHDRLLLGFNRELWQGWLDSKVGIEVEAVSADKASHSNYSLESLYSRQSSDRLLWRAGLIAYTGKIVKHSDATVSSATEGRSGVGFQVGMTWHNSPKSTVDIDLVSRPRFESFGKLFTQMMTLDSTARGVTVESPIALHGSYNRLLSPTSRLRVSATYCTERHRPFWVETAEKNWRVITRKAQITTGKVELELEPLPQLGVTLFGSLTDASSSGREAGSNAPFVSPGEIGCDAIYQIGHVTLENSLSMRDGTTIDFDTYSRSPDIVDWNVSLHWSIKPGLTGRAGINNILNRYQWEIPDYALPPLTFWVGLDWRGNEPIW